MSLRDTKSGDTRLNIQVERDELFALKQAALNAKITLKKYVRLKLGLDRETKEKSK